ncbi:MAG: phosphoribosylanthranilate isomerase [Candidatus Omnitrophica bacterium]|nr:phosphoribosylanthranilate isomerase [Candidatus Omnitrophota bacterium]
MVKVKICGITNVEDALLASRYGADALGLIFSHKSPRSVTLTQAKKIIKEIDPFILTVGVFVNEVKETVHEIAGELRLGALQFHGEEPPAYCSEFRKSYRVIKTIFPHQEDFIGQCERYHVDAYLFDMSQEQKQQGCKKIPKDVLKKIEPIGKDKKIIISGGLTADNVRLALTMKNIYAVDAASGIESVPAKKNEDLMRQFIYNVKTYEST